jgi:hypothetical protein
LSVDLFADAFIQAAPPAPERQLSKRNTAAPVAQGIILKRRLSKELYGVLAVYLLI